MTQNSQIHIGYVIARVIRLFAINRWLWARNDDVAPRFHDVIVSNWAQKTSEPNASCATRNTDCRRLVGYLYHYYFKLLVFSDYSNLLVRYVISWRMTTTHDGLAFERRVFRDLDTRTDEIILMDWQIK